MAVKANQQLVTACCGLSLRAGVRPGMTVAHARALLRHPVVVDADPGRDRFLLERLARWMVRFSPFVAIDRAHEQDEREPDCLLLDLTGCDRLFGGERCLLGLMTSALTGLRLHHRIGVGPNIASAWAGAHFGGEVVTVVSPLAAAPPGDGVCGSVPSSAAPIGTLEASLTTFFAPLPTASLRLPASVLHALDELGLETVADVLRLPRLSLPSRFGRVLLTRIDQALGRATESFTPLTHEPPLVLEQVLEGPTTNLGAVEAVARGLLRGLAQELARRESGVTRLCLQIDRLKEDCRGVEVAEEGLTLSRPSRSAKHLWSLLRPRVERLHLGNGVERVALIAKRQRRVRHRQVSREDVAGGRGGAAEGDRSQGAGELIDALVNRLGEGRVLRAVARDSHLPERVEAYEKVVDEGEQRADGPSNRPGEPLPRGRRLLASSAPFWSTPPRPSVLFDPPEHVSAIAAVPDRPPSRITWHGEEVSMIRGIGPERINEEWWRVQRGAAGGERAAPPVRAQACGGARGRRESAPGPLPTNRRLVGAVVNPAAASTIYRDYYRVQDTGGRWLWVFRESESGRWFVHGVWA